jgi:hypothetical protein
MTEKQKWGRNTFTRIAFKKSDIIVSTAKVLSDCVGDF